MIAGPCAAHVLLQLIMCGAMPHAPWQIWIARNPPGFAFIDYEDFRDAEDAVRKLDGMNGWKVEISRSRGPAGAGGRGGPSGRG